MKPRPLLVGETNPHSPHPDDALYPYPPGSAGGRLCRLLRLPASQYVETFDRVNLIGFRQPWTKARARFAAPVILDRFPATTVVFMLGAKVAEAFSMQHVRLWGSFDVERDRVTTTFVRLPHPSGRCREWNDPRSEQRLRRTVRRHLKP